MSKLDWMYHRKSCQTCAKTDGYLEENGISVSTIIDCKKQPMTFDDAKKLLNGKKKLFATKGTKVYEVDLNSNPDDDQLKSLMIGPSGKLRAPTIQNGDVVVIGFNKEMYDKSLN